MRPIVPLLFVLPVMACAAGMLALAPGNPFTRPGVVPVVFVPAWPTGMATRRWLVRCPATFTCRNCRSTYKVNYYNSTGTSLYPPIKTRPQPAYQLNNPVTAL